MGFLAIDVGNTSAACAFFENGRIVDRFRVSSANHRKAVAAIARHFRSRSLSAVGIGSVVPKLGRELRHRLPGALGAPCLLIGKDIAPPIRNLYRRPSQVGADRLLNAVAAARDYGRDAIVVDFGTAVTFDVVSMRRGGEYLGGVIAPGIEISLEALFDRTALLPKIRLQAPASVIGRDTADSIRAGCAYGIAGLCDRLVEEISNQLHRRFLVIATGGYAPFMKRYCRRLRLIDPELTLRGILYSYERALERHR